MVAHSDSESPIPQDTEAEQALLGAVLLDNTLFEQARSLGLEPLDFWSPAHRVIYESMAKLADAVQPLDFFTLCNAISDSGNLESVGGRSAVSALIDGGMKLANLESYVNIIKEKAKRRRIIKTAEAMKRQAADPGADAEILLSVAADSLELARGDVGGLQLRPVQECGTDPEPVPLIRRTGDRFGSVLAVGEVCILSGPGKVGKSTLARQITLGAASWAGRPDAWQEVAGLDVRGGPAALVTFEDSDRRTFNACRLLKDPIPAGLGVLQARGHPLFGVREGEHLQARPQRLPAWFQVWAQIRKAKARLVVVDPIGSAFLGNSASVEAARAFIDALRTEAERAECGILLIAHSTKDARKEGKAGDPGQVSGSAAFSDAARAVMVLAHDRLSLELGNYCRPFQVDLEPITEGGRFAGFREAEPNGRKDAPGNTGITENDL